MPRMARIAVPTMLYHIISRGNNREWVFNDEEDFEKYLEICKRYKERHGFKLYNRVLMNNHVHLLLETKEGRTNHRTVPKDVPSIRAGQIMRLLEPSLLDNLIMA